MAQTSHICSIYHVFEIYIHLQMYNTHEYMEYLLVSSIRILVRYILVEYEYGFERTHEYSYL